MNNEPIDAIRAKCEYPNCDNERKCFHYCSKHHKLFCIESNDSLSAEFRRPGWADDGLDDAVIGSLP